MKADASLDTSAEPESPKGIEKFKLKTKKDLKKPKKESKTSLKSVESTTSNLSSNATFADRSLAETTVNVSAISTSPSFTKTYDYTEDEHGATKKRKPVGGFTYETNLQKSKESISEVPTSPSKRAQGLAFNYAPGEAKKVAETAAEKRKTFMEKAAAEKTSNIKTPGISEKSSADLKTSSIKTTSISEKSSSDLNASSIKTTGISEKATADLKTPNIKTPGISEKTATDLKTPNIKTPGFNYVQSAVHKEESVKKNPKASSEATVEPTGEVAFTKTVLEKKVTSASAETTVETEKKKSDSKSGFFSRKSKENESGKGVLEKAMDKLGSLGKASKDKAEVDVKKESSDFIENEKKIYEDEKQLLSVNTTPLIVKTTTKQTMIKDKEGVTQNIEEKVEDLRSGEVTVSTQHNKVTVV